MPAGGQDGLDVLWPLIDGLIPREAGLLAERRHRLNQLLAHHTGQSIERIAQDTDRDNFMSGESAVAYGLIDKMLDKRALLTPPAK